MAKIKTSSAKAKGRNLQHWVCEQISRITGLEWGSSGKDKPIESRPMGQHGCDVRLDSHARQVFPYSVECKFQETWSIPGWIEQSQKNIHPGTDWLLVCKRSRKRPIAILDAEVFFDLISKTLAVPEKSQK